MSICANWRVSQSRRALSPMPPPVVSRFSTSGSPLFALRPFGQPASASSFFAPGDAAPSRRAVTPFVTTLLIPASPST